MKRIALGLVAAILLACTGCAQVLSKNAISMADQSVTFDEIRQNPDGLVGKLVILGGSIAGVKNAKEGNRMEVVQFPLDSSYFPAGGHSGGRFLVEIQQFLDPMVYKRGRAVTVFGEIKGKKTLPLDETDYTYPVLQARELYLWPEPGPDTIYYPPPPYYDPYYFYGPFDPWYGPYWYRPFGPYRHW